MMGEQIKEKREQMRMTQEELAEKIGVSRQAISKWEQNLANPSAGNLQMLRKLLELDEKSLVEDQPRPNGIGTVGRNIFAWSGWAVAAILVVILVTTHLHNQPDHNAGGQQKMIGYIQIAGDRLTLDEIEFVTDEDTERIKELGLTEADMPDGYYIVNEDFELTSYRIDKTSFTYIDWEETDPDKRIRSTRAVWEFIEYLSTYTDNGAGIPFWVEVMDGEVLSVAEQYVP